MTNSQYLRSLTVAPFGQSFGSGYRKHYLQSDLHNYFRQNQRCQCFRYLSLELPRRIFAESRGCQEQFYSCCPASRVQADVLPDAACAASVFLRL
jgi:hypothetical protein